MSIGTLLSKAQHGELDTCINCPWSPKVAGKMAFCVSCVEHGMNWEKDETAVSMIILQDPGGTTPEKTGRLCTVDNARNPTDKTAEHSLDLWKAAVSLDFSSAEAEGYLKHHYWTNAIMHGIPTQNKGNREKRLVEQKGYARRTCSRVLSAQIEDLTPKVIIAGGVPAITSLFEIGLLDRKWGQLKQSFNDGAYKHEVSNWHGNPNWITVFCTYHTSVTTVNTHIALRYDRNITENLISEKTANLQQKHSVNKFLEKYGNVDGNPRDRGMRYLLNHWLDIGSTIREIQTI